MDFWLTEIAQKIKLSRPSPSQNVLVNQGLIVFVLQKEKNKIKLLS